jgi:hypothetical protein
MISLGLNLHGSFFFDKVHIQDYQNQLAFWLGWDGAEYMYMNIVKIFQNLIKNHWAMYMLVKVYIKPSQQSAMLSLLKSLCPGLGWGYNREFYMQICRKNREKKHFTMKF